jgi:hypothetical protein
MDGFPYSKVIQISSSEHPFGIRGTLIARVDKSEIDLDHLFAEEYRPKHLTFDGPDIKDNVKHISLLKVDAEWSFVFSDNMTVQNNTESCHLAVYIEFDDPVTMGSREQSFLWGRPSREEILTIFSREIRKKLLLHKVHF